MSAYGVAASLSYPGAVFYAEPYGPDVRIGVRRTVPSVKDGAPFTIEHWLIVNEPFAGEERILGLFASILLWIETHELREHLRYKGELLADPHGDSSPYFDCPCCRSADTAGGL